MNARTLAGTAPQPATPSLADRYERQEGRVFLNGNQALIRLAVEQIRSDRRRGLRTQSYMTGFPGSPLGGFDMQLKQAQKTLDAYGIRHQPGQNEELAATALMGTQMLNEYPHPDVDGVIGYWYGKGPGLDRSGDALKHGNFSGTSTHGAVVILSGEDHEAKSSTVPYQMEFAFEHHGMPVLYPASVQEFIDMGLHAVALSRFSGCWVAMKLVGTLCDGGEVVHVSPDRVNVNLPEVMVEGKSFRKGTNHKFFPGTNLITERELYIERHAAVLAYARANGLNQVSCRAPNDRIGIISAGKSYTDTRQALEDLGFDEQGLHDAGIRLAKVGLLCPMDGEFVREFARGLSKIIVVEEKRDFLERQVGHAVCGVGPIQLLGKVDVDGSELFPVSGGMTSDIVADRLGRLLAAEGLLPAAASARLACLAEVRGRESVAQPGRSVNFCSGCPHNISTRLAPGQLAWGAPGCHIIAAVMDRPERKIVNVTQLGGEGLPWIGLSPYTSREHIVQNVGDGALYHSSYQNIRYAVATGVNITFKLLMNGVVANTGGQALVGDSSIATLLAHLELDGVARSVLITKEPKRYAKAKLPASVLVRGVDDLESSLVELEAVPGVTILVYDGECANERRRRQKRGKVAPSVKFTVVNEEVCENCGDCGQKANCMSLQKVDTEFGRKTQIHQSSCNQDQSCIKGECPSFVTVEVDAGTKLRRPARREIDAALLPEPVLPSLARPYHVYIPGLGGTGVLTASAILAQAVALDGNEVKTYDQTGAAQKWGAVLSSLIISQAGRAPITNRVGAGKADLYLALDLMAGVDKANLGSCARARTVAVINSNLLPNGDMIRDPQIAMPTLQMVETIKAVTRGEEAVSLNARGIAEQLFGDYMMANMVAIGAAYQAGLLPVSGAGIEAAIRLNGTQVENNVLAFRAGRLWRVDPAALAALSGTKWVTLADRAADTGAVQSPTQRAFVEAAAARAELGGGEAARTFKLRVADLLDYQGEAWAGKYVTQVAQAAAREYQVMGPQTALPLTQAVIHSLHKLMAYKDEYEVARLLTQPTFAQRVAETFDGPVRLRYNLQPPLARGLGLKGKVAFGPWLTPVLRLLAKMKAVRGTPLDPFGYLAVRKQERALIGWYGELVQLALDQLTVANWETAVELLSLPQQIRGYEEIKAAAVLKAQQRAQELLPRLGAGSAVRVIPIRDTTGAGV